MITQLIEQSRKIIIKFGSNTLANSEGKINTDLLSDFADQTAAFIKKGKQIVIVSSGAQVAGLSTMDKWARKKRHSLQTGVMRCRAGRIDGRMEPRVWTAWHEHSANTFNT